MNDLKDLLANILTTKEIKNEVPKFLIKNFIINEINKDSSYNINKNIFYKKAFFPKTENNNIIKDNFSVRKKESSPLLDFLHKSLLKLSLENPESLPVLQQFLQLKDLDDPLITLILENLAIDTEFHHLKFGIMDIEFVGTRMTMGRFNYLNGMIWVSINSNLFKTLIHEMAHASVFFIFRPTQMLQPAIFPCEQKQTFLKNSELEFNPAELKFKQCVRHDKKHLEENMFEKFLFSPEIDLQQSIDFWKRSVELQSSLSQFFTNIETSYQAKMQDNTALKEVFSFYMEIRASLLQLAKDYHIEKKSAMAVLHRYLPRLHDYFETDIKRILRHRLRYEINDKLLFDHHCLSFSQFPFISSKSSEMMYKNDVKQLIQGFSFEKMRAFPESSKTSHLETLPKIKRTKFDDEDSEECCKRLKF